MLRTSTLSLTLIPLFVSGICVPHAYAAQPDTNPVSAADIVRRSIAVNTSDWNAQPHFTYREQNEKSKTNQSGSQSEPARTYDVVMLEGTPYYRLVAINREPLSRAQEQQEQAKLQREILRRENESSVERQARVSKYQNERAEEHLLMQEMARAFDFKLNGEEQINGIDCYVLDATPNPDYRPTVQKARVLTGMQGRLWISKEGYHWAKVQAEVTTPVDFGLFIAKVKPGTRFELRQAPVGNIWLPQAFTQTVNASVLGLYGIRTSEASYFTDYRPNDQAIAAQTSARLMATNQAHTATR